MDRDRLDVEGAGSVTTRTCRRRVMVQAQFYCAGTVYCSGPGMSCIGAPPGADKLGTVVTVPGVV